MTAPDHDATKRPQSRYAAGAIEKTATPTFYWVDKASTQPDAELLRQCHLSGQMSPAQAVQHEQRQEMVLPIEMLDDPCQAEQQQASAREALARAGLHDDFEAQTFAPLRTSVLTEAEGLVHGARNEAYGHPLDDFTRTAGMVSAMLAHKLTGPLTAEDVGMFMCCVKLSRQVNAPKRDNMVDLAGYAETVQWCIDERGVRK